MFDFDVVTGPMPDPGARREEKREPKHPDPAAPGMEPAGEGARGERGTVGAQSRPSDRRLE